MCCWSEYGVWGIQYYLVKASFDFKHVFTTWNVANSLKNKLVVSFMENKNETVNQQSTYASSLSGLLMKIKKHMKKIKLEYFGTIKMITW